MLFKISKYYWFGILGIVFWIADTYSKIFYIYTPQRIFWFCSLGFLIVLIGYFRKNSLILTSTLCLLFIIEVLWTISLFLNLTFIIAGVDAFTNVSKYVFAPDYPKVRLVITMYHFLILPTIAIGLYKIKKIHKHGWIGATFLLLMFLCLGYFFPDALDNMNCSYLVKGDPCYQVFGPFYHLGYPLGYSLASILLGLVVFLPINFFASKFAEKNNWKVEDKIRL